MKKMDFSGMSIQNILDMPYEWVNTMNRNDLAQTVSRLASAANKRIKRLTESGIDKLSPAVYSAQKRTKGKTTRSRIPQFSVKGKNVNELRAEFLRAQNFLSSKTSTVSGTRAYIKSMGDIIKKNPTKAEKKRIGEFYEALHKLKESDPAFFEDSLKYKSALEELKKSYHKGMSIDDMYNSVNAKMTQIYEREQEAITQRNNSQYNPIK